MTDQVRPTAADTSPAAVLVIDDSPTIRLLVRRALHESEVTEAVDGAAGLKAAFDKCPDVVLLDRHLPGEDGLVILAELVRDERTCDVPVIFLTADDNPDTVVSALNAGAHDFVRKPFLPEELVARVRGAARLKRLGDELRQVANRDALTGLLNRRAMQQELRKWVSLHTRYEVPVSVLVGDLRGFKVINDQHGHSMGDQALITVSDVLRTTVRVDDVVARWGGDEFVVLLPHTDLGGARILAERLVAVVAAARISEAGPTIQLGITLGAADNPLDADGADMLHRADLDLYEQRRGS